MKMGAAGNEALTEAPAIHETLGLARRVIQALTVLRDVEGQLRGGDEPGRACGLVARGLGELIQADVVVVSGAPADGERALPVASYAAPRHGLNTRLVDPGLAAAAVAALPPGGLVYLDLHAPRLPLAPAESQTLLDLGVQQLLVVPMIRQGRPLGRIDAWLTDPTRLTSVELDMCQHLAGQAATALALAQAQSTAVEAAGAEVMLQVSDGLRQAQPGSPSELLQVVVSLLPRLLSCDRSYAYLWHAERDEFRPTAVEGMHEDQVAILKQHPMSPQRVPLFEQLFYSTRPSLIDDALQSTLLPPELAEQLGMRALLALPIRGRRSQALGALLLDYQKPEQRFTPGQVALAGRVVEHVAAMVENATLYEELTRRSDRLAVLNEIGLDLASLTDLPTIFPALHAKLASAIDASALVCALVNQAGAHLTIYHMAGTTLATRQEVPLESSLLLAQVFEEHQGVLLQAGAAPLLKGLVAETTATPAESLVCVPMRVRGQTVVGALAAYSTFVHAYSRDDLELLSTVASQIAVTVENARLYKEVQAKGELRGHLLDRIMSAHELERKSIVDDIHDESLQALVSSMYKIDLCLRLSETKNHQRELEELRNVRGNLSANVDRLRSLIFEIRPSTLDYLGLLPTLDDYLARQEKETGIRAIFRSELGTRLDSGLETLIYRLLQQLLSNVRKHSRARTVTIGLKRVTDGVQVIVEDDGVGFVPETVLGPNLTRSGIGLAAVSERVLVAGGTFELDSRPGAGTRVRIVLPLNAGRHITGPLDESRLTREVGSL